MSSLPNHHHHHHHPYYGQEEIMKYLHDEEISELSSDEWRRYGEKRRLSILNEDRQKGGAKFNINSSYKIDRYFQIIRRVSMISILLG